MAHEGEWHESGYLFRRKDRRTHGPDVVSQRFNGMGSRTELPRIRVHDYADVGINTIGSLWVFRRLASVECSSGPVKTHPRHHRVPIGREPTTTWTAPKQLPRPIRVLSASRKT